MKSKTAKLKNNKNKSGSGNSSFFETWKFFVICIIIAIAFRSFAFSPFHIPSGSMKSTLLIGDFIFVSKGSYGYSKYSIPLGFNFNYFDGRIMAEKPERGEIIVFRPPTMPHIDFIKRLIGLPGDKIRMKNGILFINGKEVPKIQVDDFVEELANGSTKRTKRYLETLPNGLIHYTLDADPTGKYDNTREFTVPEGHYFFMGDNRDNSTDSRSNELGFVPFENLIGRAEVIVVSTKTKIWKFWEWLSTIRSERFWTDPQLSDEQTKQIKLK